MVQLVKDFLDGNLDRLGDIATLLVSSSDTSVSRAFEKDLYTLLHSRAKSVSEASSWVWLGRAWVAFALAVIELYVADQVLDPLVVQNVRDELNWRQTVRTNAGSLLFHRYTTLKMGNSTSPPDIIDSQSPLQPRLLPRESDVGRLESLYREILRFKAQVISKTAEHLNSHPTMTFSDAVLQGSISGFALRLKDSYPEFSDLTAPILWALSCLRMGLRLSHEGRDMHSNPLNAHLQQKIGSLIRFPAICAATSRPARPSNATADDLLLEFSSLVYEVSVTRDLQSHVSSIREIQGQLVSLWLHDRDREQREQEEATSLYKTHRIEHTATDDEENEEEDFKNLFPQFDDLLDEESNPNNKHPSLPRSSAVSPNHMQSILRLHLTLFGSKHPDRASYTHHRRTAVSTTITSRPSSTRTLQFDVEALPWRHAILADMVAQIQVPMPMEALPNFYNDPNIPETRKAIVVLGDLRVRLCSIAEEWPDQMVIQHLIENVDKILALAANSSVARVLAALEKLLLLSNDWESYANKDNTLKLQQAALISLIVTWRRLELQCWRQLLVAEARRFEDGTAEWWFRLYELVILGTISAVQGGEIDLSQHLARTVPLLDDFLSTSPMGQYRVRLDLLHSFATLLRTLSTEGSSHASEGLARMARILASLIRHYSLSAQQVELELVKGKAPIEKDIVDYIKLASWKDVNVYALKQSAEKTHRHLHRCVRKYRDFMRKPANTVLPAITPPQSRSIMPASSPFFPRRDSHKIFSSRPNAPAYLSELSKTHTKFVSILNTQLTKQFISADAEVLEEFAAQVFDTLRDFESVALPSEPKAREKAVKSVTSRKRRSIADLSKELKRLGVSQNPRPEVVARLQSRASLFELSIPEKCYDDHVFSVTLRGDRYFHQLVDGLQAARSLMPSHHSDFSTRELQRLLSLAESLFDKGLLARERYYYHHLLLHYYELLSPPIVSLDSRMHLWLMTGYSR